MVLFHVPDVWYAAAGVTRVQSSRGFGQLQSWLTVACISYDLVQSGVGTRLVSLHVAAFALLQSLCRSRREGSELIAALGFFFPESSRVIIPSGCRVYPKGPSICL